jgi:hypothetical protein
VSEDYPTNPYFPENNKPTSHASQGERKDFGASTFELIPVDLTIECDSQNVFYLVKSLAARRS